MRDDEDDQPTPPPRKIADYQRRTAQSVADLALGLQAEREASRNRHQELVGLILATSDPNRKRRATPESTDKFRLPAGISMEVPRETTKSAIEKAGKWAFYIALFLASHLANCLVNHAHWPAAWQKPAAEDRER